LSLGIETLGGVMTKLIDRNTTIPTRKSETFSTAEDDQTAVTIRVFQGEREMAADNKLLGQFDLVGIPPAPRGAPQIEVTFDIDANGIVNVSAKDKSSGKQQTIRIQASGGLNEAEVERMVREAEAHAEEDRRRRELVDLRNQADAAIYAAEKARKDAEGRLPADVKSDIDGAVSALRAVMQRDQAQPIRDGIERLRRASMRIGEAPNRAGQGSGGQGSGAGDNPDVIDAEFKEVDDDHRKAS
jgi:molecular chaperone DnaK